MSLPRRRHLRLDLAKNVRDVGGYPTRDGRVTRWRTLLRGGNVAGLSESDVERLSPYGLRTVIDLRHDDEVAAAPCMLASSVRYVRVPFGDISLARAGSMAEIYRMAIELRQECWRIVLAELIVPGALPALVQCAAGKDRTGTAIALALGGVGVADETLVADFARSRYAPEPMRELLVYLAERYGGITAYLERIGFGPTEQAALRLALTRPARIPFKAVWPASRSRFARSG
jgi:protein-tyrosine phosphatase